MSQIEISEEMAVLLHLTRMLYRKPPIPFPGIRTINIPKLLDLASRNNLLHITASNLLSGYYEDLGSHEKVVKKIVDAGNKISSGFHNSLDWMNECFSKHDLEFLIIKSYLGYPRLPHDIDILVKDLNATVRTFLLEGGNLLVSEPPFSYVVVKGPVSFHIQQQMHWAGGIRILDESLLWRNPREVSCYDAVLKIPNREAEFLIHIGHAVFERFYFDLSVIFYLYRIGSNVDYKLIQLQARKYRWIKSFLRTLKLISSAHYRIYKKESMQLNWEEGQDMIYPYCLPVFPLAFSRMDVIRSFIEKGIFIYPLMTAVGTMRMIVLGKKFHEHEYISIPEQEILKNI